MREILSDLDRWLEAGEQLAIARVVDLDGSGPRLPGAAMAVTASAEVAGSVSGGCVEGAVVTEALDVIATGQRRLVTFGYSDDEAFAVGLTCGGTIHLFVEPFDWGAVYPVLRDHIATETPVALANVIEGIGTGARMLISADTTQLAAPRSASSDVVAEACGTVADADAGAATDTASTSGADADVATQSTRASGVIGSLGNAGLDRAVERDVRGELIAGRSGIRRYGERGEIRDQKVSVFVESFASPPRMVIFGAVDFTAALARVAKILGYRVIVCDARSVFATARRFPMADEVVVSWPDRLLADIGATLGSRDAVCVLTHDAKFDVPAITGALETDVGYIGVMGSRRTHDDRTARLVEAGVTEEGLARLRSPIGLDIGAATPEETAISIVSEVISLRTGRRARALSTTEGPIHD